MITIKQKLTRLYSKIKNTRKYMIHKITKEITNNNDYYLCPLPS